MVLSTIFIENQLHINILAIVHDRDIIALGFVIEFYLNVEEYS
jgi:hypothetical protein